MRRLVWSGSRLFLFVALVFGLVAVGCEEPQGPKSCNSTLDCTGGRVCTGGVCSDCTADTECAQGRACKAGRCVVGCRVDANCPSGQKCLEGFCAECLQNSDCSQGNICKEKKCVPGCASDTDCQQGKRCGSDGSCADCLGDGDCKQEFSCIGGTCQCPPERACLGPDKCADLTSNATHCGGCNNSCQLGLCEASSCRLVVETIALGSTHSCAIASNQQVRCWGSNASGELGVDNGDPKSYRKPVVADRVAGAKALSLQGLKRKEGFSSTCAVLTDKTVKCWGNNDEGQLGNGTTNTDYLPVTVSNLKDVEQLVSGMGNEINNGAKVGFHRCALLTDKTVKCWGSNAQGELGDGTKLSRTSPVPVINLKGVKFIATGGGHSCAVLEADGAVYCWGLNNYGQLGTGTTVQTSAPIDVKNLSTIDSLALGLFHSCALQRGGEVYCWGYNKDGQVAPKGDEAILAPVKVQGVTGAVAIAAGEFHTCALLAKGEVVCWGANQDKVLGEDVPFGDVIGATTFKGLSQIRQLAIGHSHSCVVVQSLGVVKCWGNNDYGKLGNNDNATTGTPASVFEE